MAGDWIKIEKATVRKREVLMIAGELGVHPDHAFGLCFRFWSWCDDNLSTGHALGVTNVLLDQLLGHDGFSTALVNAGWLRDREGSLEVPHFDRHLSQSSKNRALANDRKKVQRDKVTTKSQKGHAATVTKARPEKRREENTKKEAKASCPTPSDVIEKIWPIAPKSSRDRSSKKQVSDEWNRIKAADRPSMNELIMAIQAWIQTEGWQTGYAEGLHLWIKRRKWESLPEIEIETKTEPTGTRELQFGGRRGSVTKITE